MKRGTIDHPKTAMLADALELELFAAVGLLECLFHFTAQYARRGDIGRYSNRIIAQRCFWQREPDQLVNALLQCRWLDEHPEHRLIVHDWHAHADNTVRQALERNAETFWNGDEPRKRRDAGSNTDATALEHGSNTVDTFQAKPSRALPNQNESTPTRARGSSVPTVKDVQGHAVTIGLAPAEAQNFFDYYEQRGWTDRNGQPVRNWQAALRRWKVTAQERKGRSKALQTPVEADYRNPNDPLLGKGEPA